MGIIGKRISLHKFQIADIGFLFELNNNLEVNKYLSYDSMEQEKCADFIKLWTDMYHDELLSVHKIVLDESRTDMGLMFLVRRENGCYELGYRLLPHYWHKGYAYESAKLLIDKFFEIHIDEIIAETHQDNTNSIGFLNRIGFREVKREDLSQGRQFKLSRKDYINFQANTGFR